MKTRLLIAMILLIGMCTNANAKDETVTRNGIIYGINEDGPNAYVAGVTSAITKAEILSNIGYKGKTYPVTGIGDKAFYDCTSLISITIPDEVSMIGSYAFYNCAGLTSIIIPEGVTEIWDNTFSQCRSLISITFSDRMTQIGDNAFLGCSSLTSIAIPNGVTQIGDYAFYYCTSLTSITIPDGMTEIREKTFYNCTSLTSVTLPAGMTEIGLSAFNGCSSLTSITLPAGVTKIREEAFWSCSAFANIYCLAINPPSLVWVYAASSFDTANYTKATLHIPTGCTSAYQAANEWKKFTHIVEDATAITATAAGEPRILGATLYTTDGTKVRTLTAEEAQSIETLTAPQRGVYLLRVQTDKGIETRKVTL